VGWEAIDVDPSKVTNEELRAALKAISDKDANGSAAKIRKFVDLEIDDIVLVCCGYSANQKRKEVHIYGIARVTGPFRAEPPNGDWRFKHNAVIQTIEMDLPRDVMASALGKETLLHTIHSLTRAQFDQVAEKLKESGVHLEV
jgi:hypothetical protein